MIRLRLFTDEEWFGANSISDKERRYHVCHTENYVGSLPYRDMEEEAEPAIPFRDAESLQFLRESWDVTFVSDDDWFSVMDEFGRRMNIACLNKRVLFGLAAVALSRNGYYAALTNAVYGYEEISRALANLPYDILIGVRIRDIEIYQLKIRGTDYLIENYPYKGQTIEVTVKDGFLDRDDFYTPVPESSEGNTNCGVYVDGLYVGRDGRYYTDSFHINFAFQYQWKTDIEELLGEIDRVHRGRIDIVHKGRIPLADPARSFSVFEFGELAAQNRNSIMWLAYVDRKVTLEDRYQEGELDEAGYEKALQELDKSPEYEEYLYFRDTFKIICHLTFSPPETSHRKLPMLIADRNRDGTWLLHDDLTVKYPEFHELFWNVIRGRSAERERFILIVDVEEKLREKEDIKYALCGFRVRQDSVDVYDAYEGALLFGGALKEAYDSGKYTVK